MLVGADGIRSHVRKQLQPDRRLLDLERWIIWGRTLLTPRLKERLPPDLLTWCMYLDNETNVQAVVEPMSWSKGVLGFHVHDYVYWCLCAAPRQFAQDLPKTLAEKAEYLERISVTWHPDLKLLIDSAALELLTCMPVLSSKPHIEVSATGQADRITLIGDAARAMSPMGGSGADSAICNAADLAQTIAEGVTRYTMRQFESRMEARAKVKIEHSFRGGQKFWQGKEWTEYSEAEI
ncbi:FAD/NAD(P)-binding domain-containing protein [Xylaria arbuscula]|nr:FAD/NAD(P)-binding domain-containing protein [Xylaria arbuscula]